MFARTVRAFAVFSCRGFVSRSVRRLAQTGFEELLRRAPHGANAIALINVEKSLNPHRQRAKLADKAGRCVRVWRGLLAAARHVLRSSVAARLRNHDPRLGGLPWSNSAPRPGSTKSSSSTRRRATRSAVTRPRLFRTTLRGAIRSEGDRRDAARQPAARFALGPGGGRGEGGDTFTVFARGRRLRRVQRDGDDPGHRPGRRGLAGIGGARVKSSDASRKPAATSAR